MRVLGSEQEGIQEQPRVKGKRVYLERYTFHRQNAGCLKVRATPGYGVIGVYGLSNFIVGGIFLLFWGRVGISQELGHCPLFGLFWSSSELSLCKG